MISKHEQSLIDYLNQQKEETHKLIMVKEKQIEMYNDESRLAKVSKEVHQHTLDTISYLKFRFSHLQTQIDSILLVNNK